MLKVHIFVFKCNYYYSCYYPMLWSNFAISSRIANNLACKSRSHVYESLANAWNSTSKRNSMYSKIKTWAPINGSPSWFDLQALLTFSRLSWTLLTFVILEDSMWEKYSTDLRQAQTVHREVRLWLKLLYLNKITNLNY